MTAEVLKAVEGMTIEEGMRLLVNNNITGVPVVDDKNKMIGVFSEYDVILVLAQSDKLDQEVFRQKIPFSREVQSVSENTPLEEVLRLFVDSRFRRLPVLDSAERLVGIITRRDIMRLFYYRARFAA